jgi:Na+/phosphate symporter
MTISNEACDALLSRVSHPQIRQMLAEVLAREYTELSDVEDNLEQVTDLLEELDVEELRRAQPETLRRELRDFEGAMTRLSCAFSDLTERLNGRTCGVRRTSRHKP